MNFPTAIRNLFFLVAIVFAMISPSNLRAKESVKGALKAPNSSVASAGLLYPAVSELQIKQFDTFLNANFLGALNVRLTDPAGNVSSFVREQGVVQIFANDPKSSERGISLLNGSSELVTNIFNISEARFDQSTQTYYCNNSEGFFALTFSSTGLKMRGNLMLDGSRYEFSGDFSKEVTSSPPSPAAQLPVQSAGTEFPFVSNSNIKLFEKESNDSFLGTLEVTKTGIDGKASTQSITETSVSLFTASSNIIKGISVESPEGELISDTFNILDATFDVLTSTYYFNISEGYYSLSFKGDNLHFEGNLALGEFRYEFKGDFSRVKSKVKSKK